MPPGPPVTAATRIWEYAHGKGCRRAWLPTHDEEFLHTEGKWCWTVSERRQLRAKREVGQTWNDIAHSFTITRRNSNHSYTRHDPDDCSREWFKKFSGYNNKQSQSRNKRKRDDEEDEDDESKPAKPAKKTRSVSKSKAVKGSKAAINGAQDQVS